MANIPLPPITTPDQVAMNALDFAQFTQSANQFVGGVLASLPTPFVTAATTATTFLTAQINPGFLSIGSVIRFKAGGTQGGTGTNTLTINFGSYSLAIALGTTVATPWFAEGDIVVTGAATQAGVIWANAGAVAISPVTNSTGAQSMASAFAITMQSTNTTASQMTTNYATIEMVR